MRRIITTIFVALASLVVAANVAMATMPKELVSADTYTMVALEGYDPVAFFTDSKPIKGDPGIQATHNGSTYFFATKAHQKAFEQEPKKYLPQYGGYCAVGAAMGVLLPVDISTWSIHNGKLYFNFNQDIARKFQGDLVTFLGKADVNWPGLVEKHGN